MQKKLIALAVAGLVSAPAFAQSNVTVYGIMDLGVYGKDTTGNGAETKVDSSGWLTSRLGFRGTEDLGNGLKAIFQLETAVNADNAKDSAFATSRDSFVGLTGSFGTVKMGHLSTAYNDWAGGFDHSGLSNLFKTVGYADAGADIRVANAIAYVTPNISGLTGVVMYGVDEDSTDGTPEQDSDAIGAGLRYDNGPLAVAYTYTEVEDKWDNHFVGGSYDFGVVKAMLNYGQVEWEKGANISPASYSISSTGVITPKAAVAAGDETEKSYGLGLAAPIGAAGTASVGYNKVDNSAGLDGNDADVWGVTYKHDLSKRTFAYVGYQQVDYDKADDTENYGVGIAHKF